MAADRLEVVASAAEELDAGNEDDEEGPSPIERNAAELRGAAGGLRQAFASGDDVVSAFEMLESPFDRWRLAIRAVAPAEAFHARFMDRLESFAAVSASIFVSGDAFAAIGELEIEEHTLLSMKKVSVESPFPYAEHMRFVALKQPEGDLVEETAEVLAEMARQLRGRTLGLFTSLRRMNQTAELLSEMLRGEGFEILAPRRASDDPRGAGGALLPGAWRRGAPGRPDLLAGARHPGQRPAGRGDREAPLRSPDRAAQAARGTHSPERRRSLLPFCTGQDAASHEADDAAG